MFKKFRTDGTKQAAAMLAKILPYVLIFFLGNRLGWRWRHSSAEGFGRFMDVINLSALLVKGTLISFVVKDIITGAVFGILLKAALIVKSSNTKNYRNGEEYGSAKFGTAEDIKPFINYEKPEQNLILSATERLSLEGRMENPIYNRNKNLLCVGGSGAGKTRFLAKPNIMQMACSMIITDPKGSLVEECGQMLVNHGYKVRILNTVDFEKSNKYNPFMYIKCEDDVMKVADALIEGTTIGKQQGEQFWIDAERLLYNAFIGYIYFCAPESERNFTSLLAMVNAMEIFEEDDGMKNAIDFMFEELAETDEENFAVAQYKKFKLAAGKTAKSIMISVGARLSRFDIKGVRNLMETDELYLDSIGDELTALFIVTSDTSKTYNFIATIFYTQVFNLLCERAEKIYHGRLPIHVHCILDEFANLGRISDFEVLITTIRSREISATIILQSLAQLKNRYDKAADIISDNCDSFLFLGGKGRDTLKEISEMLGKETIDIRNTSDTKGSSQSVGVNYQKLGRDLFTPDELGRMPGNKCIVQIKGVKPFYSDKYDIEKHPRYKELADYDERNRLNIGDEISGRLKLKKNMKCRVIRG